MQRNHLSADGWDVCGSGVDASRGRVKVVSYTTLMGGCRCLGCGVVIYNVRAGMGVWYWYIQR